MTNTEFIEKLANSIRDLTRQSPVGDLQKNIHALLQGAFTKLELVSREEYDVQARVLRDTREKLDHMQKKIEELEDLLRRNNS